MSIWESQRAAGVPGRFMLGLWLTYRKLASSGYVPDRVARQPLRWKLPYWYVFDFALAPRAADEQRVVTGKNFYLLGMMATQTAGAVAPLDPGSVGFRAQILDVLRETALEDRGENGGNLFGTAQQPFWLREPYFFCAQSPIVVRVTNGAIVAGAHVANTVQLVLYGVSD